MNKTHWLGILITLMIFAKCYKGEISLWMDKFQRDLCRERWLRMDWQSILRPCRKNMKFGLNIMEETMRSSTKWSHVLRTEIKKTGEFSRIVIQSRNSKGVIKKTGGDSWRVFIRGPSYIAPLVSDLNNGAYQATFLIMEPGLYRAEIILESSLCEGFQDPPKDWKPTAGWIKNSSQPERRWQKLRGGAVSFKVEPSDEEYLRQVRNSIGRWRNACGQQYQCELLWTGFGRWTNGTWLPLVEERRWQGETLLKRDGQSCENTTKGTLLMMGDCITSELYAIAKDTTLCNETFTDCDMHSNCRRENITKTALAMGIDSTPNPSEHHLLTYLRHAIKSQNGSNTNAILINFGHDRVEKMPFDSYKRLIDKAVRYLPSFQGSALWRTTASIWGARLNPHTFFSSYQRTMLFNAYATSQMCGAGLPTLDIFQMATSYPQQPIEDVPFEDRFYDTVSDLIRDHFEWKDKLNCGDENNDDETNGTRRNEGFNQRNNITENGTTAPGIQSITYSRPKAWTNQPILLNSQSDGSGQSANKSTQISEGANPVTWNGIPIGHQSVDGSRQATQESVGSVDSATGGVLSIPTNINDLSNVQDIPNQAIGDAGASALAGSSIQNNVTSR